MDELGSIELAEKLDLVVRKNVPMMFSVDEGLALTSFTGLQLEYLEMKGLDIANFPFHETPLEIDGQRYFCLEQIEEFDRVASAHLSGLTEHQLNRAIDFFFMKAVRKNPRVGWEG